MEPIEKTENEQSIELACRYIEIAFIRHGLDRAMEMLAPDYVLHDPARPGMARGPAAWREAHAMFLRAFPDHRLTVLRQLADGDFVVTHWKAEGTQMGGLPGIPATRLPISITGITITRVERGKIAEEWQNWDTQGLLEQLEIEQRPKLLAG